MCNGLKSVETILVRLFVFPRSRRLGLIFLCGISIQCSLNNENFIIYVSSYLYGLKFECNLKYETVPGIGSDAA